jgi:hypothetical protein
MARQAATVSGALVVLAAFILLGATTAEAAAGSCPQALSQRIPARSLSAETGSEFVRQTAALSEPEREAVIAAQLMAGNLPGFLRSLKPVTLGGHRPGGEAVEITLCVTPDYLALGSDTDFLRIPMGLGTALATAARFGFVLPTPRMVDAIYEQAEVHLRPQPLPPGPGMRSNAYYWEHQKRIREQRIKLRASLGALIAGQKKDVVVSNRLWQKVDRVAIYGWHQHAGAPIQPLSTVHGARYADYSHGVRLVSAVAFVNGQSHSIFEILTDPSLAGIISDEGPIVRLATLIEPTPELADQENGCSLVVAC